jgi:catechol 2,3-dioxygenase-like lactoylglutathione lyase family enzyme
MTTKSFTIGKLHHVELAIPLGAEMQCRAFWGDVLGMDEVEKPLARRIRASSSRTSRSLRRH